MTDAVKYFGPESISDLLEDPYYLASTLAFPETDYADLYVSDRELPGSVMAAVHRMANETINGHDDEKLRFYLRQIEILTSRACEREIYRPGISKSSDAVFETIYSIIYAILVDRQCERIREAGYAREIIDRTMSFYKNGSVNAAYFRVTKEGDKPGVNNNNGINNGINNGGIDSADQTLLRDDSSIRYLALWKCIIDNYRFSPFLSGALATDGFDDLIAGDFLPFPADSAEGVLYDSILSGFADIIDKIKELQSKIKNGDEWLYADPDANLLKSVDPSGEFYGSFGFALEMGEKAVPSRFETNPAMLKLVNAAAEAGFSFARRISESPLRCFDVSKIPTGGNGLEVFRSAMANDYVNEEVLIARFNDCLADNPVSAMAAEFIRYPCIVKYCTENLSGDQHTILEYLYVLFALKKNSLHHPTEEDIPVLSNPKTSLVSTGEGGEGGEGDEVPSVLDQDYVTDVLRRLCSLALSVPSGPEQPDGEFYAECEADRDSSLDRFHLKPIECAISFNEVELIEKKAGSLQHEPVFGSEYDRITQDRPGVQDRSSVQNRLIAEDFKSMEAFGRISNMYSPEDAFDELCDFFHHGRMPDHRDEWFMTLIRSRPNYLTEFIITELFIHQAEDLSVPTLIAMLEHGHEDIIPGTISRFYHWNIMEKSGRKNSGRKTSEEKRRLLARVFPYITPAFRKTEKSLTSGDRRKLNDIVERLAEMSEMSGTL